MLTNDRDYAVVDFIIMRFEFNHPNPINIFGIKSKQNIVSARSEEKTFPTKIVEKSTKSCV